MSTALQPQAMEASLEKLPVEIFHKIRGHLAFFDKKALQSTSKSCYYMSGELKPSQKILWLVHAYRSGLRSPLDSTARAKIWVFIDLISDCLERDGWIDLSQGQEAQDSHQAFLNDWDSIEILRGPLFHRPDVITALGPRASSGRQGTVDVDSRCTTILKMSVLPQ